ncbi:hypothetical protein CCB81_05465 [Armatimonadetes bacterium Uphvl-Ar2]|nr:hypothetical protein CCB81_05465 [Armatimonadetes bacterium Uphvl-Ar2]
MKLNRPTLALALLCAALTAPAQTALHPEIDAFRSGDKAYVVAPPRPVAAFDYVVEVQPSFDGAEWMLVQHRSRRAQDGAAHITESDYMRPTETSLYHPGRNMVRPLPSTLPQGQLFLDSGVGDVVLLSIMPSEAGSPPTSRKFALDVPSGRLMELSDEKHVLVVNNNWFLTRREDQLSLVNWNGDRRPIPMDQTPSHIRSIGEPGRFVVGTTDANRRMNWHLVDINSGRIVPADNDTVIKAYDLMGNPPGLMILPEADRPESHTAWFANPEGKEFLDFASPTFIWGTADGRLPHELDSRAVIAGDLVQFRYGVPAGYASGAGRNLGAAWYVRDRMMFVRAVEEMSIADYAKYIARFVQNRAMNMAKQAGVALNIFSADNEDRLPENAGWREAAGPYLKNDSILGRVTYLGNGERLTEVQDLQGVVGFIDTPYGRANISYDSSVRWVPKVTP